MQAPFRSAAREEALNAQAAAHYQRPATPRELRAQSVQRLQIGLFGLAMMLLLVSLATIILQHAHVTDSSAAGLARAASSSGGTSGDPLADIGVVPAPDASMPHRPVGAPGHPTPAH